MENGDTVRGAEGVERRVSPAQLTRGLRIVISSPSGVWGKPGPKMDLVHCELKRTHLMTTNLV